MYSFRHPFILAITFLGGLLLRSVTFDLLTFFVVTGVLSLLGSFCLAVLNELETEVAL